MARATASDANEGTASPSDQYVVAPIVTSEIASEIASVSPKSAPGEEIGLVDGWNYVVAQNVPELPQLIPQKSPKKQSSYNPWSCVSYVRYKRPDQDEPWGSPNKVQAYPLTPSPGLIVITTEGPVGHAAYIESVASGSMTVSEANYIPGKVTTRTLPIDAPQIRGYR